MALVVVVAPCGIYRVPNPKKRFFAANFLFDQLTLSFSRKIPF
jgi:hypothetical protein